MEVVVIGITGRLGKRIARELLSRGHDVLGVNRRPERVPVVLGDLKLPMMVGDTADYAGILECVRGAEVVVLATAPTREHPEAYPRQSRNVIEAAKAAGVRRLIALSNYKALRAPDGRPMLEAEPPHPYFYAVEAVFAAEAEIFRQEEDLDWLLVAPPAELYPYGEVTREYRVGEGTLLVSDPTSHSSPHSSPHPSPHPSYKEVSRLSMEDLAFFVAEEIERQRYSRALVTLAY